MNDMVSLVFRAYGASGWTIVTTISPTFGKLECSFVPTVIGDLRSTGDIADYGELYHYLVNVFPIENGNGVIHELYAEDTEHECVAYAKIFQNYDEMLSVIRALDDELPLPITAYRLRTNADGISVYELYDMETELM